MARRRPASQLLAIAKEADRDVWEQRNEQFNQMLVCAVLMFGVAVGNINEGTYHFDKEVDEQGMDPFSLLSPDGLFVLLSGLSVSSLFVCIISSLLLVRRMSTYMIQRSANLVERLANSTGLAHQLSGAALKVGDRDPIELHDKLHGLQRQSKRFHAKMGEVMGEPERPLVDVVCAHSGEGSSRGSKPATVHSYHSDSSDCDEYHAFVEPPAPVRRPSFAGDVRLPPRARVMTPPSPSGQPVRRTHITFSSFWSEHCLHLQAIVILSFVVGVVAAWGSVWLLLWNEFPHLFLALGAFGFLAIVALVASLIGELRTRSVSRAAARASCRRPRPWRPPPQRTGPREPNETVALSGPRWEGGQRRRALGGEGGHQGRVRVARGGG